MKQKVNRRNFLKAMGAATLAVSLGSLSAGAAEPELWQTNDTKIAYAESRTARYFAERGITNENFYMTATCIDNFDTWDEYVFLMTKHEDAVRFRRYFMKKTSEGIRSSGGDNLLVLGDTIYEMNDTEKQYQLYTDKGSYYTEEAMKGLAREIRLAGCGYFIVPDEATIQNTERGERTINNKKYETETVRIRTDENDDFYDYWIEYCYDGDELKYIRRTSGMLVEIKSLTAEPNDSYLSIPRGYEQLTTEHLWSDNEFSIEEPPVIEQEEELVEEAKEDKKKFGWFKF